MGMFSVWQLRIKLLKFLQWESMVFMIFLLSEIVGYFGINTDLWKDPNSIPDLDTYIRVAIRKLLNMYSNKCNKEAKIHSGLHFMLCFPLFSWIDLICNNICWKNIMITIIYFKRTRFCEMHPFHWNIWQWSQTLSGKYWLVVFSMDCHVKLGFLSLNPIWPITESVAECW